uniref:Cytochrome b n=1 Tax=Kokeshia sp. NKU02 TaxID=1124182 RepID=A0A109NGX4_9HEMI|nr:cytochrome b [Kokeshia sp. NKU02]
MKMPNYLLFNMVNKSLINLPTSSSISLWWNFGSLLSMSLAMQIMTGVFLAMHYTTDINLAFNSIIHIIRDVNNGWLMRNAHSNGASLFFICIYIHMGRGMYYGLYKSSSTWESGTMLYIMVMMTAFLGYVLPWGQMSFWGVTVITNLLSAIPYIGNTIVNWLWGGFSINNATLTRFFTLHFIMPFIMTAAVMMHLMFLHQKGSKNPLGTNSDFDKVPFHPYFTMKDYMGVMITMLMFMLLNFMEPLLLMDPENFTPANPMVTPPHIQPEWYFLFAYTILRSIPNKLGGVTMMAMSITMIMMIPMIFYNKMTTMKFYPVSKMMNWMFINTFILLSWIGTQPAEEPYIFTGQAMMISYFMFFPMNMMMMNMWDKMTN